MLLQVQESERTLNTMELLDKICSVEALLESKLSHFITLTANSCGYVGTTEELVVN